MKKSTLLAALTRLGELATHEGLVIEATIYGGVAMLLLFDSRTATKDIDAILRPEEEALRLAKKVAREMDLPDDWIESRVSMFLSHELIARESVRPLDCAKAMLPDMPGLRISTPNPRYLIAMKARALRPPRPGIEGDWDDIAVLIRHENIRSCAAIDAIIEEYFPDYSLADKSAQTRAALAELVETIAAESRHDC